MAIEPADSDESGESIDPSNAWALDDLFAELELLLPHLNDRVLTVSDMVTHQTLTVVNMPCLKGMETRSQAAKRIVKQYAAIKKARRDLFPE